MRPSDSSEWIVAPATAAGSAAIAIVRLDGPGCWAAAAKIWRPIHMPFGTQPPSPPPRRHLTLGYLYDSSGAPIDRVMAAWFEAPHSYTGNDLVEFHCHGSPAIVVAVVDALMEAGARMARPGEFTERSFFNGRIDLAQAEGVASLIASQTREAGRAALSQIEGGLSRELHSIHDSLVDLAAEIEARLDFPEDEIAPADQHRMAKVFLQGKKQIELLLTTTRRGRLFSEGARVVIAGKPNTGKSSLFNALLGMERALVTPHPGTTRDTIEATVDLTGIPVVLVDTAGVREKGAEEIERLGIERALREISRADLVLFVIDGSRAPDLDDLQIFDSLKQMPHLIIINKSDLPAPRNDSEIRNFFRSANGEGPELLRISTLQRDTLANVEQSITERLKGETSNRETGSPMIINLRHEEQLSKSLAALGRAEEAFSAHISGEFVIVDLNEALQSLAEILGISIDGAVLSRIFSKFCIGK